MATFNISIPLNQLVDVSCPGTPVPNTGMTVDYTNTAFSNGNAALRNPVGVNFQIRGMTPGACIVTVISHNAANVQFSDTINITVTNPTPDATGSGMTISAPHV